MKWKEMVLEEHWKRPNENIINIYFKNIVFILLTDCSNNFQENQSNVFKNDGKTITLRYLKRQTF